MALPDLRRWMDRTPRSLKHHRPEGARRSTARFRPCLIDLEDRTLLTTLSFTSASSLTFTDSTTSSTPFSFTVAVTATPSTPVPKLTESGVLPSGLTFKDNGNATATLSGTLYGTAGTYTPTFSAQVGTTIVKQTFTLTLGNAPGYSSLSSATGVSFATGQYSSYYFYTTGSPKSSLTETGTLPAGVTFTDNGSGTGILSATSSLAATGIYPITVTAHNGFGTNAVKPFTLTVVQKPAFTSATSTQFTMGQTSTFTVTASGFPAATIATTSTIPGGLTFHNNGNGTATISGNPTSAGTTISAGKTGFVLYLQASNSSGTAYQTFDLYVTANTKPVFTSGNAATFNVGSPGSFTVATTGAPTPTLTETGALPTGVTFKDNGNGTATIGGTPAAGSGNTYVVTINASNSNGTTAQTFTLTDDEALSFTSAASTTFTASALSTFTVSTRGFPGPTLAETGALPTGVTFTDNKNGTATIGGTPGATTPGTYHFTITASRSLLSYITQSFTLTVSGATTFTSAASATFAAGASGTFKVTTAGFPVATLSEIGALPANVSFHNNGDGTATISGLPSTAAVGAYPITINAVSGTTTVPQSFTLSVTAPPSITSANNTTTLAGTAGSFTVTTGGFPKPSLSEVGALPSGVSFTDNGNGTATIAGTPSATSPGIYVLTITAQNGIGTNATQTFTITDNGPPLFGSASAATFTAGAAGTFSVTTTGYPIPTLTATGGLPSGLSFVDNGNGTATISGTPDPLVGGVYDVFLTAHNAFAPDATQDLILTVNGPPSVTSANTVYFRQGTTSSFTVTAAGFPYPALSETGSLPSGLSFTDNGDGTATIAGTPGNSSAGNYPLTITAHANGNGPNSTQSMTLVVTNTLAITSAASTTFAAGSSTSFTVTTSGSPTPALFLSPLSDPLPTGVTFVDNHNGTATLHSNGSDTSGGVVHLVIVASNGVDFDASQSFTITLNGALSFTSANTTTFTTGKASTFTVSTIGFPTPSLSVTGALPSGVTFTDNHNGTATIKGTPAANAGNTYSLTITAHNGVVADLTQSFTLIVNQALAITSGNNTTFTTGTAGTFTVIATGYPAPTLSESGALPSGVTLTTNAGVTTLAGTPAAGTGGVYPITITAHNGVATDVTQKFTLTVNQAAAFSSVNSATFAAGTFSSFMVTTTGYPTVSTLSASGTFPTGVSFHDNGNGTASLAGTAGPLAGGVYTLTITAHNGIGTDPTQTFTLTVNALPTLTNVTTYSLFRIGTSHSVTLTTSSYPTPPTIALDASSVALPSGLTLATNSGVTTISGTPAAGTAGFYFITLDLTNSVGTRTVGYSIEVDQTPAITSGNTATFKVGTAGTTFGVTTTGFPTPDLYTTSLPGGIVFTDNGDGTGTFSGTPAAGTGGSYSITITATSVSEDSPTNPTMTSVTQTFTLVVDEAPKITSGNTTTFTVGTGGTFSVTTLGYPLVSLSKSGTLPTGVTFVNNGDGTATLAGTPAAGQGGSYTLTITAHNTTGPDDVQTFTLVVDQAPNITSASSTAFTVGHAGTFSVTTTGYPTNVSLSDGGATMPTGVTFVNNGDGTATLAGTPAAGQAGTYTFTITASNGVSPNKTQTFTLTVS